MDAILFSANLKLVNIDAAIDHLLTKDELFWEVGFKINPKRFIYPIFGFIHLCGSEVKYRVIINNIIPFSKSHYEDKELSRRVKPPEWLKEWETNKNNIRNYFWKSVFVIKFIEAVSFETYKFLQVKGGAVTRAPQNYIMVKNPQLHLAI